MTLRFTSPRGFIREPSNNLSFVLLLSIGGVALLFDDQQVSVTEYITSCTFVELAFELGFVLVVFIVEAECGEPSITTGNWGIALLFDDQQVSVTGYVTSCTCRAGI